MNRFPQTTATRLDSKRRSDVAIENYAYDSALIPWQAEFHALRTQVRLSRSEPRLLSRDGGV
ncbi:hypothetical protein CERZMDRAFT_113186 [Cercospora zeae-maydis SCOH1-5]|uniref:Uncharacterized protein n=1 Tax=Cercospora zeae-maydis SCOH1-5 TaxID=717836 RepID=A0A6A6FBG0_9PEZI|nr:hypothetical protein CERZMDRAFT_113186 [Cercospora zeae-maydis SCOH1-5]